MKDPMVWLLGSVLVSVISCMVGRFIGVKDRVSGEHCRERRSACQGLLLQKIEHLAETVERIERRLNSLGAS